MRLQRVMFEEAYPRVPAGRPERQAFLAGSDDGATVELSLTGEILSCSRDGVTVWQCHQSKARFWEPAYSVEGAPSAEPVRVDNGDGSDHAYIFPDTDRGEPHPLLVGDATKAQLAAYGAAALERAKTTGELVGWPEISLPAPFQCAPAPTLEHVGGGMLPLDSVYPNEAEQRTQAEPEPTVSPITRALEDAGVIERMPPSDAFEVLTDAVGVPMRRGPDVHLDTDEEANSFVVNESVDTPSQPVHAEVDTAPKPLSRKQRRKLGR